MDREPFDQPAGIGDRLDDLLLRAETWLARSRTVLVAGILVAVAAAVAWWSLSAGSAGAPIEESIPRAEQPVIGGGDPSQGPATTGVGPSQTAAEAVIVHVVGAVRRPGLVTLAAGDRISDAVGAAGGALPEADVALLNLASPLVDGMQIRVPVLGATDEGVDPAGQPLVQLPETGGSGGGDGSGPVDLNRSTSAELQRLPGIGPALAGRIVAWRDENGGFTAVDDLEAVPGIGPAKLAALRDLVVV